MVHITINEREHHDASFVERFKMKSSGGKIIKPLKIL